MNTRASWALLPFVSLTVFACHDSSRAAEPKSDQPEETRIDRAHREVKEHLGEAAEKSSNAADNVQKELHKGAQKVGTELGMRPEVTGAPRSADGGAR